MDEKYVYLIYKYFYVVSCVVENGGLPGLHYWCPAVHDWKELKTQGQDNLETVLNYFIYIFQIEIYCIVQLRWLEPLWYHENLFETVVVQASEGYY